LKANPGKVSYASQGNGTTSHLTASMFMQLTGTEMIHIPYKGTAPALVDLIGGQVDVFFDNLSSSLPFHQGGRLRILAVADEQRSAALAQVPTFAELKLPAMNAVTWFAVVGPPNTPTAVAGFMQKSIAGALALPDVKQKFAEQGAEPRGWSPEQTGRFIRAETEKWNKVIKSANVKLE
jgi:tripartite-type tricarboxylate transporter receptor subunit TctC